MDRKFIIRVSNNRSEQGRIVATWVALLEELPTGSERRYKNWYTDYIVRADDLKGCVEGHIAFLKSFGATKENICIEDERRTRAPDDTVDSSGTVQFAGVNRGGA
jgi:hypothetical protein